MKTISLVITLSVLASATTACAQGNIYLSNLGELSSGSVAVANDSRFAQAFFTGANYGSGGQDQGFTLNSVQLLLGPTVGAPGSLSVSIYASATRDEGPGGLIGSLSGVDPSGEGIYTYSASGITLSSLTAYWLVLSTDVPLSAGSYSWSIASTTDFLSPEGWTMRLSHDSSSSGTSWLKHDGYPLQFALSATPVPEPSTLALFLCWGALVAACRWRLRRDV